MLNTQDVTEVQVLQKDLLYSDAQSAPCASAEAPRPIPGWVLQNLLRRSAELNTKIVFSDAPAPAKFLSTPGEPERQKLICLHQATSSRFSAENAARGISQIAAIKKKNMREICCLSQGQ